MKARAAQVVPLTSGSSQAPHAGDADDRVEDRVGGWHEALRVMRLLGVTCPRCREPVVLRTSAEPIGGLSRIELQVLCRVGTGQTDSQMARELGLTIGQMRHAIRIAKDKLGARNRPQAISIAMALGLLGLDCPGACRA